MSAQTSASAGGGTPLVQHGVATRRRGHEDSVAILDHLLYIVECGVKPAVRHIVCLADLQDLLDTLQHFWMVVLPRVAEFLGEVALPGEDDADARHLLQHLWQVANALRALDHQAAEQLALGVQGPYVGAGVVLLLGAAPVGGGALGGTAPTAERLAARTGRRPGGAE